MSLTKKKSIWIATVFLVFLVSYIPAVFVDIFISKKDSISQRTLLKMREIEAYRSETEDKKYRKLFLQLGYEPLFFPNLIRPENTDYVDLVERFDVAPLAPQPLTNLYYCNEGYGLVNYKSDRFGFRNVDSAWEQGRKSFLIGDSFVHGACMPNASDTIAGQITGNKNIINLGTSSNGPIHYAAIAKAIVSHFKPLNVVMVFYPNDNTEGPGDNEQSIFYKYYWEQSPKSYFDETKSGLEINRDMKNFYEIVSKKMRENVSVGTSQAQELPVPVDYFLPAEEIYSKVEVNWKPLFDAELNNFALKNIIGQTKRLLHRQPKKLPFSTILAIDELAYVCSGECKPLVVYIPNSAVWRPDARAKDYLIKLASYASEKGIDFLDASKELEREPTSKVYAKFGPHLSPFGYGIVAKMISARLQD